MLTQEQIDEARKQYGITPVTQSTDGASAIGNDDWLTTMSRAAQNGRLAKDPREALTQSKDEVNEKLNNSFSTKVLNFTGGTKIAQGLGQALNMGNAENTLNRMSEVDAEQQKRLFDAIKKNKEAGKDTTRLEAALRALTGGIATQGNEAESVYNPGGITGKEVIGDAIQLATTVAASGSFGAGAKGAKTGQLLSKTPAAPEIIKGMTKGTGLLQGAWQGFKSGAISGAGFGAVQGTANALKNNEDAGGVVEGTLVGGAGGGLFGGVLGSITGAISGVLKGRALTKEVMNAQERAGLKPTLDETIKKKAATDPKFAFMVNEAKKQGFGDPEINFLSTVSDVDKPVMQKMYDLTVKAQSDPRQITRAGDILGDNVTQQVKQVIGLNQKAGKAVDATAKALKGRQVDIDSLGHRIVQELDNAGVVIDDNGVLDFSGSVFKNVPAVQKELQKVIYSVPNGSDAYQLHIFKKGIDEMVDYGTAGEGLSGQAANILKSFRNATDEVLDKSFTEYDKANTFYKLTRDYIEQAKGMVGKKVDLSSKEGAQAFGQALRSAFSNNKSRPNTLKFIEDTHLISKKLGLTGSEKNLLDQALFVNMLEETFGSEAATGLAGEVSKAINKSMQVVEGIKNPVKGALNLAGVIAEKVQNVTPDAKKQILKQFIK